MTKRLIWSAVIAAVWCLSMIHAEHVGMREQAKQYDPKVFEAYDRGLKDGTAIWKPKFDEIAAYARACHDAATGPEQEKP
jgi:hypothetical protein